MSALACCTSAFAAGRLLSTSVARPRLARQLVTPRPSQQQQQQRRGAMGVAASASGDLKQMVLDKNAENSVIVYSKTYCPYCSEVKSLFQALGVPAKVVELDTLADGAAVQSAVAEVCGRSTVPQVFIGGKHVGGCDDTMAAKASGKLKQLLQEAGVSSNL